MAEGEKKKAEVGAAEKPGGDEASAIERVINRHVGDAIHLFLSLISVLILAAAVIAAYQTVVHDFPKLFGRTDEFNVLQKLIESVLLIAIAAELGLLLLYHRTSTAVEVIIFVIARKIVSPDITALDLLLSVAALAGLLVARFYFLPGKPK
ncbi:MAG: hypothetical protein H7Z38_12680 [Rubrivivax sp.]|nr:hypothetical protein [Pyrinomonadaceae bacterium]